VLDHRTMCYLIAAMSYMIASQVCELFAP
jgi:hypothetical protein